MVKDLLKTLGIEVTDEMTDEDAEKKLEEHITTLASEKETLSKANEELTASVEGYKSSEEKLTKELSETKTELATYKGKLEQVTEMYKEQFSKDPEEQENTKSEKELGDDVLQQILDTK